MADDNVELLVGAIRYPGWESIQITRSMESISGSFSLQVTDRWNGVDDVWPILEEDPCRVLIGGEAVIDGYVDKRSIRVSKDARTLTYTGRDRAAALVDCSASIQDAAGKRSWTFNSIDLLELATKIAAPFGIDVTLQPGLSGLMRNAKIVIAPGDKCFEVLAKVAAAAGVLLVSDGSGGIVITRAGDVRASALVQGQNIMEAEVENDSTDRFHHYVISSQLPGTDDASGNSTRVQAQAIDDGVRRADRFLLIRPDKGYNAEDARRRAQWEARIRAARAEKVTITVQGWRQPSGKLWTTNQLSRVRAPMIGVDGDMLISQVDFSIDNDGGRVSRIGLVRPDAFDPEPSATVKPWTGGGGWWPELNNVKVRP